MRYRNVSGAKAKKSTDEGYGRVDKAEVYVENAYYEFLTRDQQLNVKAAGVFEDYNFDVDYVISMGGDGTFLKAASRVGAKGTPIIGVNMGRLGFLADVLPSEIESALDSLYTGDCLIVGASGALYSTLYSADTISLTILYWLAAIHFNVVVPSLISISLL